MRATRKIMTGEHHWWCAPWSRNWIYFSSGFLPFRVDFQIKLKNSMKRFSFFSHCCSECCWSLARILANETCTWRWIEERCHRHIWISSLKQSTLHLLRDATRWQLLWKLSGTIWSLFHYSSQEVHWVNTKHLIKRFFPPFSSTQIELPDKGRS